MGQEADHLGRKGKSWLMGKDVQPLQSVKNCYNSRAHGHERLGKLTELCVLILLWCRCTCLIIIVILPLFMIMWELELKHNLATHVLMIKLDLLKLLTAVQSCQTI